MIKKISQTIYRVLSSKKFFYVIIGLLVIQAAWFALTAQYPMAFDENYHFGLIQLFSHQWLPFITNVSPSTAIFGEITRYDSYLYHYLMSFPYRLITIFIHDQVTQIIILRFLNIGLFVSGLFLFRKLFNRLNISKTLINFSLLMLVLIPIVPFLAATINYDNLTFILVPLITILTLNCRDEIIKHKILPASSFISLLIVGMLGSLVKYPFLPIFAAVIIYLLIIFIRTKSKKALLKSFVHSFTSLNLYVKIILIIGALLSFGLFVERYGVNLIQYHSLEPDCGKIQTIDYCIQYAPWGRNYTISTSVVANNPALDPPILQFIPYWFYYMIFRLYFAINYDYSSEIPLPIPMNIALNVGIVGLAICFLFRKSILRIDRRLLLFIAIIGLYIGGLFYINFSQYLQYRTTLAINGRYLVIILPLLFIWLGLAYRHLFDMILKARVRSFIAIISVVIILLLLQGGGASTHLVRSEAGWYWQNKTVIDFNLNLKNIISPLIIGGKDY